MRLYRLNGLNGLNAAVVYFAVKLLVAVMVCDDTARANFKGKEVEYKHWKSRPRGCRGSGHKYSIQTFIKPRFQQDSTVKRIADVSNLVRINQSETKTQLTLSYLNARSVNNKTDVIAEDIIEGDIDICAITETWPRGGEQDRMTLGNLTPSGNKVLICHAK